MIAHRLSVAVARTQSRSPRQKTGGCRGDRRAPPLVMAAATPIPVQLSEWLFAGIYAGRGVPLAPQTLDLQVPSHSSCLKARSPWENAGRAVYDHMGFYGGVEPPLVGFHCMTQRRNPVFLTTFSGRPPKEEAMLAIALTGSTPRFFASRSQRSPTSSCRWKPRATSWR